MDIKHRRIRELTKQRDAIQAQIDKLNNAIAVQSSVLKYWSERVVTMPACLCVPWTQVIDESEVSFTPTKALHVTEEGKRWLQATTDQLNAYGKGYCDLTDNFCVVGVRHV